MLCADVRGPNFAGCTSPPLLVFVPMARAVAHIKNAKRSVASVRRKVCRAGIGGCPFRSMDIKNLRITPDGMEKKGAPLILAVQ